MTQTTAPKDDLLTIIAISVVALMLATMLHEGVGHAVIALLTGATSGTLSTVAWSSTYDSRLVAAGGTIVNLIAGFCSGSDCALPGTRLHPCVFSF
jgi:hypothetical protein